MATLKIECADSIGALRRRTLSVDGKKTELYAVTDDESLWFQGVKEYVGYHKATAEFFGQIHDNVFNYTNTYIAGYTFTTTDLSFLNTSNLISAKLVLNVFRVKSTGANISLASAGYPIKIIYLERSEIGSAHGFLQAAADERNLFKYVENIENNQTIEVDLSNSTSVIKNLVENGLIITAAGASYPWARIYGIESSSAPYIEIEYLSDDTPPTASPLSPVSDVVNGDKPITFTWSYSQDVNEPQSHYSIQQQTSSGWQNLIPKTAGTTHTATVPAGTFTAGQAAWRVMVWSQNGTVASQWSDPAYIIVQSQPKAPNITSAGTSPSPTFAWQAAQQQGYEIILGDYQAGVKYGTEKTWTYPGTLQNGNVTFQIRVQNAQGIWSPWAGVETYISNVPQGTVSLSGNVKDQAVSLLWTSSGLTASQYNVLRDGKVIATTQNTAFTDYYSAGKCAYQVYAMLSGGYYTPSNVLTEIVKPKYAMISLASSISWIPLRIKSGGLPTYGSEMQAQAAFVHYQGRELPVAYTTGFLDKSYTYSFSFLRKEDMQAFAKLCGQMVILKTPQGERSIGILTGISATRQNRINDFSFSITEIDFSEVELNA